MMTETTTERMLRLMGERAEAIDMMAHDAGTHPVPAEEYHIRELVLITSAERGVWSSEVIAFGEDLIDCEDENLKGWE